MSQHHKAWLLEPVTLGWLNRKIGLRFGIYQMCGRSDADYWIGKVVAQYVIRQDHTGSRLVVFAGLPLCRPGNYDFFVIGNKNIARGNSESRRTCRSELILQAH